jgi:recombinational DNA repair protein RecR
MNKLLRFLKKLGLDGRELLERLAYRLIRQDQETCEQILQALADRMHNLNRVSFLEDRNNEEQVEAQSRSFRQLYLCWRAYKRLGGREEYREFFTRERPAMEEV